MNVYANVKQQFDWFASFRCKLSPPIHVSIVFVFSVAKTETWIFWNCCVQHAIDGFMNHVSAFKWVNWSHLQQIISSSARIAHPPVWRASVNVKQVRIIFGFHSNFCYTEFKELLEKVILAFMKYISFFLPFLFNPLRSHITNVRYSDRKFATTASKERQTQVSLW